MAQVDRIRAVLLNAMQFRPFVSKLSPSIVPFGRKGDCAVCFVKNASMGLRPWARLPRSYDYLRFIIWRIVEPILGHSLGNRYAFRAHCSLGRMKDPRRSALPIFGIGNIAWVVKPEDLTVLT